MDRARREHHFESTFRTGSLTLQSLLPGLAKAVDENLSSGEVVREIQENPQDKVRLWGRLKVLAFARCASFIFSGVCLALLLRTQLSIIAGYLYQETTKKKDGNGNLKNVPSQKVQEAYISTCENFTSHKVPEICAHFERSASQAVKELGLKSPMGLKTMERIIRDILLGDNSLNLKRLLSDSSKISPMPDSEDEEMLQQLFSDLTDIVESSDFGTLFTSCLSTFGVSSLLDEIAVRAPLGDLQMEKELPLAKMIPVLNTALAPAKNGARKGNEWLLVSLVSSSKIKNFTANVYEAFCAASTKSSAAENVNDCSEPMKFIQRFVWSQ